MFIFHPLYARDFAYITLMSAKGHCIAHIHGSSITSEYVCPCQDVHGSPRIVPVITCVAIPCGPLKTEDNLMRKLPFL